MPLYSHGARLNCAEVEASWKLKWTIEDAALAMSMVDYLIVGAGLFGSVFAHEMTRRGKSCLMIEKRHHIGGNCYSVTRDGIDIHVHGPHIFHTDSAELWEYVNRNAELFPFRHTVKACSDGRLYSFPINLTTLKQVFRVDSDERALDLMHVDREPYRHLRGENLEDWCLSRIGPRLYGMFIRGYTTKQWRRSPRELDASIVKRLPIREVQDDSYYRHKYQGVPLGGYTPMFERLLDGIEVRLGVDYFENRDFWNPKARKVVFTGEIDRFFDYKHGKLEWRSLRFVDDVYPVRDKQGWAVINHTDEAVPYTRSIEYRHFVPHRFADAEVTHVVREFPAEVGETGEVYYPVPSANNQARYRRYSEMASSLEGRFIFGGRLARYVYIDMAPTIRMALNAVRRESPGPDRVSC